MFSLAGLPGAVAAAERLSSSPAASAEGGAELLEIADSADLVESWSGYALSRLQTNFSWASDADGTAVDPPSIFNRGRSSFAHRPAPRFSGSAVENGSAFQVAMQTTHVADSPLFVSAEASSLLPDRSPGMRRTVVAPSLAQALGESSSVRVSALFAFQRMAGFDMLASDVPATIFDFPMPNAVTTVPMGSGNQSAYGAGARVDFDSDPTRWLSWTAGYQAKINMDAFSSYRGIFGQPGVFDIPASANIGVGVNLGPKLRLSLDMERVMYGQTTPFMGSSLPTVVQVYAKLFGQYSPSLRWANLNVYSLGLSWHDAWFGDFAVHYSSQQQPEPTAQLLQQFLAPDIAKRNWEADYSHGIGDSTVLRFAAMHAPIQLLGNPVDYDLAKFGGASESRYEALLIYRF